MDKYIFPILFWILPEILFATYFNKWALFKTLWFVESIEIPIKENDNHHDMAIEHPRNHQSKRVLNTARVTSPLPKKNQVAWNSSGHGVRQQVELRKLNPRHHSHQTLQALWVKWQGKPPDPHHWFPWYCWAWRWASTLVGLGILPFLFDWLRIRDRKSWLCWDRFSHHRLWFVWAQRTPSAATHMLLRRRVASTECTSSLGRHHTTSALRKHVKCTHGMRNQVYALGMVGITYAHACTLM